MSYKERMHPKVSQAEIALFNELSKAGLTTGMVTQKPIILKSTIPDFCWTNKRKIVYLDGSVVHSSAKQQMRDREIDEMLEARGWEVLRIPYQPPITERGLAEMLATIKVFLGVCEET